MTEETYVRRAIDLARSAAGAGDEPFGSLLVREGEVLMEDVNTVETDDDVTAHPEFKLARRAAREMTAEERAETTMYTSTEPCPMCAGAIKLAGLGRVVYSTSQPGLAAITGGEPWERASTILGDDVVVQGPVLPGEGTTLHEEYWRDTDDE